MKIAIAGFGVEGKASYQYFKKLYPEASMVIVDQAKPGDLPSDAEGRFGLTVFSDSLEDADLVIRTPSLAPAKIKTAGKIWSATNEFFAKCPAPIIGVTGTKGKGTTASMIASILRAAGRTVYLVGNIGEPALAILGDINPTDIVVYELSSFQLWDLEKSPHIAVVLMIEPDHLDIHHNLEDYLNAKANIRRYQTGADICIYHPTNRFAEQIAGSLENGLHDKSRIDIDDLSMPYGLLNGAHKYAVVDDNEVYIKDGYFCVQGRKICSTDNLQLSGAHNLENACAAISAVTELDSWPSKITSEHVAEGLRNFEGLPHRLKLVGESKGVRYFDDSIATTPGSAIAALRSFNEPKIIILGGYNKGANYELLAGELAAQDIRAIILIGSNATQLARLIEQKPINSPVVELGLVPMTEVVKSAQAQAKAGDVVILSPAAASFDMFKSYSERGEQFIKAVRSLKE